MVVLVLLTLFIALPISEIYVIVQAGHHFGVAWTLLALVGISVMGASLVKRQGLRVWRRFNEQIAQGAMPSKEIADGVVILIAGALLMTPGFITDAVGLLLLLPPVRIGARSLLVRRMRRGRSPVVTYTGTATYSGPIPDRQPGHRGPAGVIDVTSEEREGP